MAAILISSNKHDLQTHSRSLIFVSFDFLLVFHCNYVSISHHSRDIIAYFPKIQEVT